MSERDLNKRLVASLKRSGLDPQRVENTANPGCGDIEFVGGWIESKFLRRWPKRSALVVKMNHFTPKQRAWHVKRRAAMGRTFVVLEAAGEVLVFDGRVAAEHLGFTTRDQLTKLAMLRMIPYDPGDIRSIGDWFKQQCNS